MSNPINHWWIDRIEEQIERERPAHVAPITDPAHRAALRDQIRERLNAGGPAFALSVGWPERRQ